VISIAPMSAGGALQRVPSPAGSGRERHDRFDLEQGPGSASAGTPIAVLAGGAAMFKYRFAQLPKCADIRADVDNEIIRPNACPQTTRTAVLLESMALDVERLIFGSTQNQRGRSLPCKTAQDGRSQ
jgi:hypothetical protein